MKKYYRSYLVKCKDCGFVFSQKKPSVEELKIYYKSYPVDSAISPITIVRYEELLKKFEPFRKTNNLLDVGCGDGHFLEIANKNNWNVYGTEFRPEAVHCCLTKGINMHQGSLSTMQMNPEYFDIITSFEVLEHINNPLEEVALFQKFIRKGGAAYITTPNFNSLSRYFLSGKWNVIVFPEHISYYTYTTLKSLFQSNNFDVVTRSSTGISISRWIQSRRKNNFIDSTRSFDEKIRQTAESNLLLQSAKKLINYILTFTNMGDALKVMFRKK